MTTPTPVKFSEVHLHVRVRGPSEIRPAAFSGGTMTDGIVDWDPKVDGVLCGEGEVATHSDHNGERHLDGDEVLYLISGRMQLILEPDNAPVSEVELLPGEAVLVPRGVWHRLRAREPSRFIFIGGGRTQIRIGAKE
jgi:mannose-6-phosphate isomerase-like protein (cupin superfamily)